MKLEVINRKPKNQLFETPLLFVHGTGHAAWCWDEYFLPFFAGQGFDAYAVSLRGHGASEGKESLKWTSIADYVADISQIASGFAKEPVIIGHSMGGLVVQKYLEKQLSPAAILVAPSPSEGMFWSSFLLPYKHPLIIAKVTYYQDYSKMFETPKLAKKFLFAKETEEEYIAQFLEKFGNESYRANLELLFNLPDTKKIKCPMLVLGADEDALVSRRAIEKTARVYHADSKFFANTGHDMMLEKTWREIAEFAFQWLKEKVK